MSREPWDFNQADAAPVPWATFPTSQLTVSMPDLARLLGISLKHAYKFVLSGELPSILLGRRRVVAINDVHAFLQRKAADARRPIPTSERSLAGRHAARVAGTLAGGDGAIVEVDDDEETL
jgi:excisionase family DNA binding protein